MVTAVVLLLCTLAASCGSSATTQPGRDRTASTSVPVMVDRGTTRPGLALARTASTAYRALIDTDSAAFAAAVGRLQADLAGADVSAARSDELAAQSAFDGFRQLGAGNTVIASALDEQASDVGPGETFAGLHAVERDLWSTVPGDPVADAMASTGDWWPRPRWSSTCWPVRLWRRRPSPPLPSTNWAGSTTWPSSRRPNPPPTSTRWTSPRPRPPPKRPFRPYSPWPSWCPPP